MKNAYDIFMIEEILPAINDALKKEDRRFKNQIQKAVRFINIQEY